MTADELALNLQARGLHVTPDHHVTEAVAAEVLPDAEVHRPSVGRVAEHRFDRCQRHRAGRLVERVDAGDGRGDHEDREADDRGEHPRNQVGGGLP